MFALRLTSLQRPDGRNNQQTVTFVQTLRSLTALQHSKWNQVQITLQTEPADDTHNSLTDTSEHQVSRDQGAFLTEQYTKQTCSTMTNSADPELLGGRKDSSMGAMSRSYSALSGGLPDHVEERRSGFSREPLMPLMLPILNRELTLQEQSNYETQTVLQFYRLPVISSCREKSLCANSSCLDATRLYVKFSPVTAGVEDVVSVDHPEKTCPVILRVQLVPDLFQMQLPQIVSFALCLRHDDARPVQ